MGNQPSEACGREDHVVVLLSEVNAEAQLVSGNELRYFFCDSIQLDRLLSRRHALASHLLEPGRILGRDSSPSIRQRREQQWARVRAALTRLAESNCEVLVLRHLE
jgi:hypothetical protein